MKKIESSNLGVFTLAIIFISFMIFTFMYMSKQYSSSINNSITDTSNVKQNTINNTQPKVVESAQKEIVEIASYTTNIYDNDKNRIHNIKLGISTLDGTKVLKGEEFSFNNTLGNMNKEQGYKKATGFDGNGKNIKVYGGGICQISSTLYNAVLIANLEVTERHAHSRRVYYVPKDKDATVFYGGPDFKFKNNSNADIIINATTDGNEVTITLKQEQIKNI